MNRLNRTTIPLAALAALIAARARAQEVTPVAPVEVVSATLTPTPLNQVGSSVTLITAADLDAHQWLTVPDALAYAPGLNVVQTGGAGGLTSVFIRGANSNHTKVVIDGIDVNDPSNNDAYDFGQALTADVARIEVLRGPQSSLYGSDALGGVINIVTKAGEGPPRITGALQGGSFETVDGDLAVAGSQGAFHYRLAFSHDHVGATPVTPLDLLPPGVDRVDDAYDNTTLSTKLGWDASRSLGFDLAARYTVSNLHFTGDDYNVYPSVPEAYQTDQSDHQLYVRADARLALFGDRFQNVLGVAFSDARTRIESPSQPYGPQPLTLDTGDRLKFDWLGTIALAKHETLVLGADTSEDRLIDSPISAGRRDSGGFAELEAAPVRDLFVAASVRYDDNQYFGGATTWRIAPSYTIEATGTRLKGSYGTGFKAPTLTQLFVSYPAYGFFANPDLKPETSRGYDVGFEQPLAHDRFGFGATWFHNAIRDLIDDNASFTSYANIDRATTYGVESFARARISARLDLRADYTYTFTRNDLTGAELLRRPKDKASLTARWRATRRLTLSPSLLYVGAWADVPRDSGSGNGAPYFVADLAAEYALRPGLTLFGRVDNLGDRRYQDPSGFLRPGIGAFAGVRFDLAAR